ncbi:ADP-ribosylhydrolase ARH1-like [Glandiceps talaboti]
MAAADMRDKYRAGMLLSAVGDALGYKNGDWEFCHVGEDIHKELKKLGGLEKIVVKLPGWCVSDDTVLHIATAEALATNKPIGEQLFLELAAKYKETCVRDMTGRAPGLTTTSACHTLKPNRPGGYTIPFNPRGGGCGAAMRAMCIGLRFPRPEQLQDLISVSVESGRMTHYHPTGYLGSLTAALFTSYAVQNKPVIEWGAGLMATLPQALQYIKSVGRDVQENESHWSYFTDKWTDYLKLRQIEDGKSQPVFPENFGVKERDQFYKSLSFAGWGGASGHDAPMIAYDALLSGGDNWNEFCSRAMFHSGDSDSTGVIGACWWGVLYGFNGVPKNNYTKVEYHDRIEKLAEKLFELSHHQQDDNPNIDSGGDPSAVDGPSEEVTPAEESST